MPYVRKNAYVFSKRTCGNSMTHTKADFLKPLKAGGYANSFNKNSTNELQKAIDFMQPQERNIAIPRHMVVAIPSTTWCEFMRNIKLLATSNLVNCVMYVYLCSLVKN